MSYAVFNDLFDHIRYPAGEGHTRSLDLDACRAATTIEATAHTFDELARIVVADRTLRRNGIGVEWFVPYFPFARHDRRLDPGDGLEIELALELVAGLDLLIADPHSEVTAVLPHLPQATVVDVTAAHGAFDDDPVIVIPDAGAAKKVAEWAGSQPTVQALKRRDPYTGRLGGFQVLAGEPLGLDLTGRPAIIVDDICDGGGTFLGLAAELADHGAGPLTLVVTHGLFTKGLDDLTAAFDRIVAFAPSDEVPEPVTDGPLTRLPYRLLHEKGQRR